MIEKTLDFSISKTRTITTLIKITTMETIIISNLEMMITIGINKGVIQITTIKIQISKVKIMVFRITI